MARAARTAFRSPSMANGTSESGGREPRTKVINGWTEATVAACLRNTSSASLVRAPLECSATFPFQSAAPIKDRAALAIAPSGTQNQTISACTCERTPAVADAPTSPASRRARRKEAAGLRETINSILYPAARNDTASALAKLPAPMMATRGFWRTLAGMPGRIPEAALEASPFRSQDLLGRRRPDAVFYYCCHGQACEIQVKICSVR